MTAQPIYSALANDPDLADLVTLYVDEMPGRIEQLIGCWESRDWSEMGRLAHQLKGASGSYGFSQVTPFALRLESSTKKPSTTEQIKRDLDELANICRRLRAGTGET